MYTLQPNMLNGSRNAIQHLKHATAAQRPMEMAICSVAFHLSRYGYGQLLFLGWRSRFGHFCWMTSLFHSLLNCCLLLLVWRIWLQGCHAAMFLIKCYCTIFLWSFFMLTFLSYVNLGRLSICWIIYLVLCDLYVQHVCVVVNRWVGLYLDLAQILVLLCSYGIRFFRYLRMDCWFNLAESCFLCHCSNYIGFHGYLGFSLTKFGMA